MENKEYTANIVAQLSELRDLLIVIERGGEKTPDILYKLAIEKSQKITDLINQWREDADPEPVEIPAEYEQWLDNVTSDEAVDNQEEDKNQDSGIALSADVFTINENQDYLSESNEESVAGNNEAETENDPSAPLQADVAAGDGIDTENCAVVGEEPLPADAEPEASLGTDTSDNTPVVELPADMPVFEIGIAEDSIPNEEDVPLADDGVAPFSDDEEEIVEQDVYNMGEPLDSEASPDTPVTISEMMSVRRAKELRRALSLNDRFRFRRELFGNSDIRMTETLALLDTMEGYAEAREYLTEDLGWDAEEPVVQEFLVLVENHFKS